MTATDELRRMLDERGVEHYDGTETTLWGYEPTGNGTGAYRIMADEVANGRLVVRMLFKTPEQAIEATLGGDTQAEREAKQLRAENAKLRELVRELWNCALQYHRFDVYRHEIGVDGCGIGCTANGDGCCACKLEQRMRELGVEV